MQKDNYGKVVKRVAGYLKLAKGNRNPAAFLTGAGASISAKIPSAPELVKQVANDFSHCLDGLPREDREDYGKCMSALSPDERRTLIKPHLDNAKINWGHIALAQIIKNGFVSRVLTFNFDLVLESALSLIGQQCPVYDFGAYPKADLALLAEPSIIHLHGQSYGFVHLNTEDETQRHKDAISPIITNTINTRPTVIIGYSGDCDPSAKTLQEQYSNQHRLTWLEYSEVANTPQLTLTNTYDYANFSGGLDFDLFMIALATELQIWPPKILSNSSAHLLDELSIVTDYPTSKDEELDIFSRAKEHLREQKDDLIVKAAFEGTELPPGASKEEQKLHSNIKASQLFNEAAGFREEGVATEGNATAKLYELSIEKYKEYIKLKPDDAVAHNNLGAILGDLSSYKPEKEAKKLCRQALKSCERALKLDPNSATAYSNWGLSLIKGASYEKENKAKLMFENSLEKFDMAIKLDAKHEHAYNNWGRVLDKLSTYENGDRAQALAKQAIEKLQVAAEIEPSYAAAFSAWGVALGRLASQKSGDESEELFRRAIEKAKHSINLKPKRGANYYNLARLLALRKDLQSMIEALERAHEFCFPNLKSKLLRQTEFKEFLEADEIKNFLETVDDLEST